VEIFFDQCGKNRYPLQFLNLSGFNGTTVFEPIPIQDIQVSFHDIKPRFIYSLLPDGKKELPAACEVCIPVLNQYAAYLIEAE